jgi:3-hydroxyisobutyrate dehydrogenase-like beta-hydroxyacid dehydrogenase
LYKKFVVNEETELLAPFREAVGYWLAGGDEEVLERLNPETRELVAKVLRLGEEPGAGA